MKQNVLKWMMILAIALCLNTVAFAEEEAVDAPVETSEQVVEAAPQEVAAPVVEEAPAPEAPAEAFVEEVAEVPAEAFVEESAELPAEEPSVEIAEEVAPAFEEQPAEEIAEIEEYDTPMGIVSEVEIEDYDTPLGIVSNVEPFAAEVKVELSNQGQVYYGDTVTLVANVSNANAAYGIRWEVDRHDDLGWSTIQDQHESTFEFVVTPKNANYDYRAVLTANI